MLLSINFLQEGKALFEEEVRFHAHSRTECAQPAYG